MARDLRKEREAVDEKHPENRRPEPDDHHTDLDLEGLRLSQDFRNQVGVKKAILTVPVRKPDRQWFIEHLQRKE